MLNEQFQSVFTSESDARIPDKGTSKHPDIPPLPISIPSIIRKLNNINPHKATGPDNISGRVLKKISRKKCTLYLQSLSIQDKNLLIGKQQIPLLSLKRETNTNPSAIGPSP